MNHRRAAALALALCLLLVPAAGCRSGEDTAAILTGPGGEVPAGVYLYHLTNAYSEAASRVEDPAGDILSQKVEGKTAEEWIVERAKHEVLTNAAAAAEFDERGLTVDEETLASLNSGLASNWNTYGPSFERIGIARSSLEQVMLGSHKKGELLRALYGEGGELEISEETLQSYYEDAYRRILMLVVPKVGLEGEELSSAEKRFEEYCDRARAGEELIDLILEDEDRQSGLVIEGAERDPNAAAQREVIVSRDTTGYPQALLDEVFASPKNAVKMYSSREYDVLFEVRELTGENFSLDLVRDTVLEKAAEADYDAHLNETAQRLGFTFNEKAIARYRVKDVTSR